MLSLPALYPITDVRIAGLSHAEQVSRLYQGGASFIQLREKVEPARQFYHAAAEALHTARERGVRIIINDRVDIALALQADGVHLGQEDLPAIAARKLLGSRAIIGLSTHNLEQARQAANLPVDYIAVGPVFATSSKIDPDPCLGLEGLSQIRGVVADKPIVAIGGITRLNARDVILAGAASVAVIRELLQEPSEIEAQTRSLLQDLQPTP